MHLPGTAGRRGRKAACAKAHGSWSYKVDVPGDPGFRRQTVKGGFATKRDADELIEHNPVTRAVPPKRRRHEARVWTAEEAVCLLTAARNDRLYAAWLVALSCGLRRGELAGLRWRDLDLERGTLSVTTQRTTDTDYRIITKAPKGTGRQAGCARL